MLERVGGGGDVSQVKGTTRRFLARLSRVGWSALGRRTLQSVPSTCKVQPTRILDDAGGPASVTRLGIAKSQYKQSDSPYPYATV